MVQFSGLYSLAFKVERTSCHGNGAQGSCSAGSDILERASSSIAATIAKLPASHAQQPKLICVKVLPGHLPEIVVASWK